MKVLKQLTCKKRLNVLMACSLVGCGVAVLTGCGSSSDDSSSPDSSTGLYVSNEAGDDLTYCQASGSSLSNCDNKTPDQGVNLNVPSGVAEYDNGSGTTYLFIANSSNADDGTLTRCEKDSNGDLTSCESAIDLPGVDLTAPANVVVHNVSGQDYLYIPNADDDNDDVFNCSIGTNGNLSACQGTAGQKIFQLPDDIAFQTADDSNTYAYISSVGDTIVRCDIDSSNGNLSGCSDQGSSPLSAPVGIAFNTSSDTTYAYIANGQTDGQGDSFITRCELDKSDGSLQSNCEKLTPNTLSNPVDIAFKDGKSYIVNEGDENVSICSVKSNGELDDCNTSEGGGNFDVPVRITFLAD